MPDPISRDEWQQADALFAQALDWPESEREERLQAACAGNIELFEQVAGLLAAANASDRFLDTPPEMPREALDQIESARDGVDLTGHTVGRYRILRSIGRGGMASVWLAVRDDGTFRREVALKIVRRGLDTDDVLARFRAERQILSSLEHPNIARLYDGGSTEDGRPFLALEYVEGRPIDEYCDEQTCSIEERLRLFVEVGRAVQFAHGQLVVHRDLKPNNILVGSDGVPKLLDFGIAKLLEPGSDDAQHQTRTGVQPLTLKYASPEQVLGRPVSTSSDVYQLGTLLHLLLTGSMPLDAGDDCRWGLQEKIVNGQPETPSDAVRGLSQAVASKRSSTPQRLSRRLTGDLDAIVAKALQKDPSARYSTAIELVEDVERHLDGQPIAATRASALYRIRKYFRRHRWAAPAITAALIVAAAYVVTVERHRRQLERERNVARAEADRATAVREFLTDIFETARPDAAGEAISVNELVDRAADQVETEFSPHPSVLAELSGTLGSIYLALGRYDPAEQHLERTVFLLEGEPAGPVRDERLALALHRLSATVRGTDVDSAGALASRAYRLAVSIEPLTFDAARVILETAYVALHEKRDSAKSARRAMIDVMRPFPERREEYAAALQEVAHDGGDEAMAFQEEALRIRRELFGDSHSSVAASLNDLAMIYDEREAGSGDSLMLRAIEIDRDVLGPAHRTTLTLLNNYAWMLEERGDREDAVKVFREVLEQRETAYPNERWRLAYPLHGLGVTLMALERYDEAEPVLRETVQVLVEGGGEEGRLARLTGIARTSLARCLLGQGRLDESERLAWRVLEDTSSNPDLASVAEGARAHLEAVTVARSEAALR